MTTYCAEYNRLNRRSRPPLSDVHITLADPHVGPQGDTLICVFLRGGADGLNIVVPHGDEAYYAARPTLAIPRPDARAARRTLDLDGFFGLHPAMAPLRPIFTTGDLAAVQAVGSPDRSRSHFQAMAEMERASFGAGQFSGWIARHLATLDTGSEAALRAVAIGEMLPAALMGAPTATALRSIEAYRLTAPDDQQERISRMISLLHQAADDPVAEAGRRTLDALAALRYVDISQPPRGRPYPDSPFGRALHTVSRLITNEVGVEVACVDLDGWDTHAAQGAGLMDRRLEQLGDGLAALYEDLGPRMEKTTVVVMSEFGRRVRENAALGTDHGSGSMMLLMGGGIAGGQVAGRWPGLTEDALFGPGDLPVTTDYRDVLAEIVRVRLNNPRLTDVFPDFTPSPVGIA